MKMQGRTIFPGQVSGVALVSPANISFYGGVDPASGIIVEPGHPLEGQSLAGRILAFPTGKGSTVGSYTLYRLKRIGMAPLAVINAECETITAVGCIISEIPCLDHITLSQIQTGDTVTLDAGEGWIEISQ